MQADKDVILQLSKDKSKKSESGKDNINIRANMYPFSKEYLSYIESLKNKLVTEEENYKNLNIQFNDLKLENENLNEKVKKLEKELKELTEK